MSSFQKLPESTSWADRDPGGGLPSVGTQDGQPLAIRANIQDVIVLRPADRDSDGWT
jgi:hypothetical protein